VQHAAKQSARFAAFFLLHLLLPAQLTHADIIVTGKNFGSPGDSANPVDWGNGTKVYIANGEPGTLDVTGSSTLSIFTLIVGMFGPGSVTVSGGSVTTSGGDGLVVGNGGDGSSLLVANGGSLSSPVATIGWSAANSSVTVSGTGSQWVNSGNVRVGYGDSENGNTLAIADGGLVKVGDVLDVNVHVSQSLNFLRLDGGYLALAGDQISTARSYITGGEVQTWSGTGWVVNTALGSFSLAYYETDAAAESLTGYSGLGGHTILTDAQPIPEPGTWVAMAAFAGGAALARWRKLRSNALQEAA
jgi:T5SS/PEP-CTERM-associated repeat protein